MVLTGDGAVRVSGSDWVSVSGRDWCVGVSWIGRSNLVGVSVAGGDRVVGDGGSLDEWSRVAMITVRSGVVSVIIWGNCMCNGGSVEAIVRIAAISVSWGCNDCAGGCYECRENDLWTTRTLIHEARSNLQLNSQAWTSWFGFFFTGTITVALDKAKWNDILVSQIFLFKHFFNFSNFHSNARGARR